MTKGLSGLLCVLLLLSLSTISWKPAELNHNPEQTAKELLDKYIDDLYGSTHLEDSGLDFFVFKKALTGFLNLKATNKLPQNSNVLSIIDYNLSSCKKRMWIIDVMHKELLLNTLVAHGKGSGDDMPTDFSDDNESHQSSLGFYITDNVYYGKNGRSLKLDGMDVGFNIKARPRAIVLHGADYVCQALIEQKGRLGRSFGCPAVGTEVVDMVIDAIKNKTVIFISGNDYRFNSKYLDEDIAANFVQTNLSSNLIANL